MNIVLLSGGGGKRLWPLSGDIHSKQFLRIFKTMDGEYESIVQRVYRQIAKVNPDALVTVATYQKQASEIKSQLGDKISICAEPERRDTFPAIVLASAFLHEEKGIGGNEAIIVCPVDQYVDDSYFSALQRLSDYTERGSSNLNLIGIEPLSPSEKYGYIIPENGGAVSKIKRFQEKPDAETARHYIEEGALWNSGVFAFRLGYLLDCARRLIGFSGYRDLLCNYGKLKKVSFDYAVVEKETNIQVMRYSGEWKDIGSWGTLTAVISEQVLGHAVLDDACRNTSVINELNLPILCMNCKDMIIAASIDGILVSEKSQSAKIKPYVDQITQRRIAAESFPENCTVLSRQEDSVAAKLELTAGQCMSWDCLRDYNMVWTVIGGDGMVTADGTEQRIKAEDTIRFDKNSDYLVTAGNNGLRIIEVQYRKGPVPVAEVSQR